MNNCCPRVRARVFCNECGYPKSEALYIKDEDQRFHPHIPDGADYKEFSTILTNFRKSLETDPPTDVFFKEHGGESPDYEDGTEVKWICVCGNDQLTCHFAVGHYRTFVRCLKCGKQEDVHTG